MGERPTRPQRPAGPAEPTSTESHWGKQCSETSTERGRWPCSPRSASSPPHRAAATTTTTRPRTSAPSGTEVDHRGHREPRTRRPADRGHRADATTEATEPTTTEPTETTDDEPEARRRRARCPASATLAEDEGEPVKGGTLVYGLEADTANAWAPYRRQLRDERLRPARRGLRLAVRGQRRRRDRPAARRVGRATTTTTPSGRCTIREGITFHDGTPLDGAAVKFNIDTCRLSPADGGRPTPRSATSTAVGPDGHDHDAGRPVGRPAGVLHRAARAATCSRRSGWAACADVPQRNPDSPGLRRRAGRHAGRRRPGRAGRARRVRVRVVHARQRQRRSGPCATRTTGGARTASPVRTCPYLDAIEAVVAVDVDSRSNGAALAASSTSCTPPTPTPSASSSTTTRSRSITSSPLRRDRLHDAQRRRGPGDRSRGQERRQPAAQRPLPPGAGPRHRPASASPRSAAPASSQPANGPFPPGSVGYLEDTGYPAYDPDAGQSRRWTPCLSELGTDSIEFTFNTTNDPFNVETNTLDHLDVEGGLRRHRCRPTITPIEQGQYIGLALVGAFQAFGWRNHGGIDPDQQRLWWQSASATPIGALALNFGRFKDAEIDENLEIIKTNPDPAARKAAAEAVNRRFGEQVYNCGSPGRCGASSTQPYVNGVETQHAARRRPRASAWPCAGRHQRQPDVVRRRRLRVDDMEAHPG